MLTVLYLASSFVLNFGNALVSQTVPLEQFLALIPQYTSCTYSIDDAFKPSLTQNELYNSLKLSFVPLNSLLLLSDLLPYSIHLDFLFLNNI